MTEAAAVLKAAGEICKQSYSEDGYRDVLEEGMKQVRSRKCADEVETRAFVDYDCSRRSLLLAFAGNDESRLQTKVEEFASFSLIWNEIRKTHQLNPAKFTSPTSKVLDSNRVNDDVVQRVCRKRLGSDNPSEDDSVVKDQMHLLADSVTPEDHNDETGNELEEAFDDESTTEVDVCTCLQDWLEAGRKFLGCAVVQEEV